MTRRRALLQGAGVAAAAPLAFAQAPVKSPTIRKIEVLPTSVAFQHTFIIGRGQVGTAGQNGRYVYVRVESEDGKVGWGETNTIPSWSYETVESVYFTVKNYLAPIVMGRSPFEQAYFQKQFDDRLTPAISHGFPFAKAAVMGACLDLAAKIAGVPLHRMLGGKVTDTIELCYALSIDTPEAMAKAAAAYPYCKCFKLKVAGDPVVDDKRVRAVVEARPDVAIWLDANQSYRPIHLESFLRRIENIEAVKCLEQPVKATDWFGLKRARDKTRLPIALDEGCFNSYDVARLARMEAGDLVVLKVMKAGGPLGCQRSAIVADANGLGLLGSGLTDSGVGFATAVHLYSTLEMLLPSELNGPEFLADMMVDGLKIDGCTVTVPDAPGIGVTPKEDKIRANQIKIS